MDNTDQVQEGQIIEDQPVPEEGQNQKQQDAILIVNLESLIKNHILRIEQLRKQLQEEKETLETVFTNDPTYAEHAKAAKEAIKVKSATRQQVLKRPDVSRVFGKIKEENQEMKDLNLELSDYLREYQRLSGANEIENDGELLEIVSTAKLVKKFSKPH